MKRLLIGLICPGLLFGCGGKVNPRPAFDDVSGVVRTRTGQSPQWARSAEETARIEERVRQLLSDPLTPEAAVEIALIHNRRLQASFEEIAVAQAGLVQAGLVSNPEFGLSVRLPDRPPSAANWELSLAQDFLDFLLLSPRKKIAVAELEQTKLHVGTEALELTAETKTAYYALQADIQLANRLEIVQEINEAALELARRQRDAGTLNELDLANHEAAHQQSRVDLAQAQLQTRLGRERLNRLMGLWGPDTAWEIDGRLPAIPDQEIPLADLESLAMAQRLDIDAARWGVNILQRALALKKGTRFFPVGVHIGVDSERETERQIVTGPTLTLSLPIFDQGKATIAQLQAQVFQQQRRLEALAVEVRSEVRESRDLLTASRDLAEFYRDVLLPQRVHILDLTQRRYNMMLKGAYDLLLAKQQEVEAERAYIEAWRDYWLARTLLEKALGGKLTGQDRSPGAAAENSGPAMESAHQRSSNP